MTKKGFLCMLVVCLLLNAACVPGAPVTPESKPVKSSAELPTTAPWSDWTTEQREYFLRTSLRAVRHGDREVVRQLIQPRLVLVPGIINEMVDFSDIVRRYGKVGWDDELYDADDHLEAAEMIGSVYAELTGDDGPQKQASNHKLQMEAISLGQEGYDLLEKDAQGALVKLLEARDIFHTIEDPVNEAKTLTNIGMAYFGLKDYDQAIVYFEQGYDIAAAEKEYALATIIACNLAPLYSVQKFDDKAKVAAQNAIEMAEKSGDAETAKTVREQMAPFLGK